MRENINVVMVDSNNTIEYTHDMLIETSKICNKVIYVTSKDYSDTIRNVAIKPWFYSEDDYRIIKLLNYICTWIKIIFYVYTNNVDILHIQWCKLPLLDYYFIKALKNKVKIVYTAHNVLPHNSGLSKVSEFRKIYNIVDMILVHGNDIKTSLLKIFSINENKIYIQKHGFAIGRKPEKSGDSDLLKTVFAKSSNYKKVVSCLGFISPYKGTDRILKLWKNNFNNSDALLVIAGFVTENWSDFDKELHNLPENVFFVNKRLTDFEFATLCDISSFLALPYRDGSMSGVVFSAAKSKKTVLVTNVGTIHEYLDSPSDSMLVKNTDEDLLAGMQYMLDSNDWLLENMGCNLYLNFKAKFSWENIVHDMIDKCYKEMIK